ncbi:MAG: Nitroreductase [Candidatus Methanohalarchaeum thermophilum]|uniref:Nitroreductase n=1 Tax=Methanohalarchaeum thermophilum TaxID=1903181 RepID=A0A1Q6DUB5_METT1|nr:MAG: Nitroreductase [Candidatus Methanohalarchaeum thermophilum]
MDTMKTIRKRRSIRSYKEKDVSDDKLNRILEAGNWAPSAGNLNSRDYILVREDKRKKELRKAANQKFVEEAPIVIIVCANQRRSSKKYGDRGRYLYSIQDSAAAIQNMLLAAYEEGLGTCWIGAFDESYVRDRFDIPEEIRPVALITVGYPETTPNPPERPNIEELKHEKKW